MKVCVIGLGRAGLPLAAVMADAGLEVIGFDIDEERVGKINASKNPIPEEPGLEELIEKHAGANLKATTDLEKTRGCKAYVVIVPLFLDEDKKPDFSIMDGAFTKLSEVIEKGSVVVLETTVPPKTTATRIKDILEKGSGLAAGEDFYLAYSPERIMTGYSISRYKEFPKVIGGINKESTNRAYEVYQKFANPVKVNDSTTAELVKVAEGVYRDVNIALANELYKLTEDLGVDFWQMRDAAKHDYCDIHEPGVVGGHCIPVYPWFLMNDYDVELTAHARKLNDDMAGYYVDKVKEITQSGIVALVGLSYRAGVFETVHTQAHLIIHALKEAGYEVLGKDPMFSVDDIKSKFKIDPLENLDEADAIILEYPVKELEKELEKNKDKIVDVKNAMK